MDIYTASQARENLYKLIDKVAEAHQPVYITGKRNNVVVISEEDYRAMEETLYLASIPGVKDAILKASDEPIDECSDKLDW